MTNPNRSLIGRRNRQSGEMFEKWLEDSCEFYFLQGAACIDKTPEPMKPLKPALPKRHSLISKECCVTEVALYLMQNIQTQIRFSRAQ